MSIGIWQVVLILLIVVILFGAGRLPKAMADVGQGLRNFRAGIRERNEEELVTSDPLSPRLPIPGGRDTDDSR